jgi:transposase
MIYAKIENPEQENRLIDELKISKDKSWYRRLEVIANSTKGVTVEQLSKTFNVSQATIRRYIRAFNQGGLDALKPIKSTGRPPKIGNWTKEDWDRILEQTPNQYEKLNTKSRQWTLERLALYIKEYHQIEVTIPCVYKALRKTGRRTGRSKLRVGSPDPDYVVKRKSVETFRNLPPRDN